MAKVTQISSGVFLLDSAVLQLTGHRDSSFGVGNVFMGENDSLEHVRWGQQDNQPNLMNKLVEKNNQVRGQLESLRDMIHGSGLMFFKRIIENGTVSLEPYFDSKLDDWAWATNLSRYAITSVNQFVHLANHFTRLEYDPQNNWFTLSSSDAFITRIGKPTGTKGITEYHINPYFGEVLNFKSGETDKLKAFQPQNLEANKRNVATIYHSKVDIPGNPFYAFPSWWCAQEWIELANLIPLFHKSGLMNGYNIKYLIRMPNDYFDKEGERTVDDKIKKEKWSKFSDNLSSWLSGTKNVNKTMLVKYLRGSDGKAMDNVDVVPLKNEMSDDAYVKVWEMANLSIANAMGILPTLAGVNPGKGNDSGSQIRVMADYQQHFRTPIPRMIISEPVRHALRAMGYTDVIPAFKEVQITTLDTNPTGAQAVINHNS